MLRKLKVYVADDHTLFRQAIVKLLMSFERIAVVNEAANGKELLDGIRLDIPDVVILDLDMPVWDGVITCKKIVTEFPEVKIIIISMHDSESQIRELLQIGAHAFLSKNSDAEELEHALYTTVDKGIYRNKKMKLALQSGLKAMGQQLPQKSFASLTEKEKEIIKFLCQGLTNRQISHKLELSENTVRNHKVRIMRRLGVKNSIGLVKFIVQNGFFKV